MKFLASATAGTAVLGSVVMAIDRSSTKHAVDAIQYRNFGSSGRYNSVTSMPISGDCTSRPRSYSGSLAPLDAEVSMHFRGPIRLKQFAFYTPISLSTQNVEAVHTNDRDDMHERLHGRSVAIASTDTQGTPFRNGGWLRTAYYNARDGRSHGISFLNHQGGGISGIFDDTYGNSLSYASNTSTGAAPSNQILADATISSNHEIVLMTNRPCRGSTCGFYRPGTVAMHGFDGDKKVFFVELTMPEDSDMAPPYGDMPSWWLLNAQIPRTVQYPTNPDCNCHESGCGELDIMETMSSGGRRCMTTFHGNEGGGSLDYFKRPVREPVKVAVVMSNSTVTIQVLDSDFVFSKSMSDQQVDGLLNLSGNGTEKEMGVGLVLLP